MVDLRRMRTLMQRLPSILWEIEKKEANATRVTSAITGMPHSNSGRNQQEDATIMLVAVKDAYRETLEELEALRKELDPLLSELEDENERAIMRLRYMYGYTPETIAQVILYHPRTVYRQLKSAEAKLEKLSVNVSKCQ